MRSANVPLVGDLSDASHRPKVQLLELSFGSLPSLLAASRCFGLQKEEEALSRVEPQSFRICEARSSTPFRCPTWFFIFCSSSIGSVPSIVRSIVRNSLPPPATFLWPFCCV